MRSQRFGDMVSGVLLLLLGLVVVLAALLIKGAADVQMQPRTLPLALGCIIGVTGAFLALRAWRYSGPTRIVPWPDWNGALRVLVTLVSLAAFLLLVQSLGMPIGSGLLVAFLVWYLGGCRPICAGLLGAATGGAIYLIFIRLLNISFPVGFLSR